MLSSGTFAHEMIYWFESKVVSVFRSSKKASALQCNAIYAKQTWNRESWTHVLAIICNFEETFLLSSNANR